MSRIVFTYEDQKYHTGSLRIREVEALEAELDVRYVELRPLGSMRHKIALMSMFLLRERTDDEVFKIIESLELDAVEDMWTVEEDDLPEMFEEGLPDPKVDASATVG